VISYSVYGNNPNYYRSLKDIIKRAKFIYPEWIIRVYHDNSLSQEKICKYTCLSDTSGVLIDNIDFCDVSRIDSNLETTTSFFHVHAMMWRFLPIGDSFVNRFMSRDTDSWITERERDSVAVWLNSKTILHAMRG
jgi:hypothetical protein